MFWLGPAPSAGCRRSTSQPQLNAPNPVQYIVYRRFNTILFPGAHKLLGVACLVHFMASESRNYTCKSKMARRLDSRCVLLPDTGTFGRGAGCPNENTSQICNAEVYTPFNVWLPLQTRIAFMPFTADLAFDGSPVTLVALVNYICELKNTKESGSVSVLHSAVTWPGNRQS